tara:strand:- start:1101 stop:1904 length:804 start_codon:yes stop_codon:yes gene_type:complete
MTILIKYPKQTKKRNKNFFKRKNRELTNLDWAKWAGWFDTDGCMYHQYNRTRKYPGWESRAILRLKDKQPVELFSKTFESSLVFTSNKTTTPEPYRYEYMSHVNSVEIAGEKAKWFTENIYPYLINDKKKKAAVTLLGYSPKSKDFASWTPAEVNHYLATALEGDGSVRCISTKTTKYITIIISSSDAQYLADVQYLTEKKLGMISTLVEDKTYMTQGGIKAKYRLNVYASRINLDNLHVLKNLVKDNVMSLDRKKKKVQEFINYAS